jgi:hypothetical protein
MNIQNVASRGIHLNVGGSRAQPTRMLPSLACLREDASIQVVDSSRAGSAFPILEMSFTLCWSVSLQQLSQNVAPVSSG